MRQFYIWQWMAAGSATAITTKYIFPVAIFWGRSIQGVASFEIKGRDKCCSYIGSDGSILASVGRLLLPPEIRSSARHRKPWSPLNATLNTLLLLNPSCLGYLLPVIPPV